MEAKYIHGHTPKSFYKLSISYKTLEELMIVRNYLTNKYPEFCDKEDMSVHDAIKWLIKNSGIVNS